MDILSNNSYRNPFIRRNESRQTDRHIRQFCLCKEHRKTNVEIGWNEIKMGKDENLS